METSDQLTTNVKSAQQKHVSLKKQFKLQKSDNLIKVNLNSWASKFS